MKTKQQRKRMLLLGLPVILAPLTVVFFYGMGGGKNTGAPAMHQTGLNPMLPTPMASATSPMDKLSIYLQADRDSQKIKDQLSRDPYLRQLQEGRVTDSLRIHGIPGYQESILLNSPDYDRNEQRVNEKVSELERRLEENKKMYTAPKSTAFERYHTTLPNEILHPPVRSIEPPAHDSEVDQLNGLLEKVLDIEHPERINKQREQAPARPPAIFSVTTDSNEVHAANAITASIAQTQKVLSGSTIQIQLGQDVYVSNQCIPADTYVSGTGQLQGDRYTITISAIQYQKNIIPVAMDVYSYDGIKGIPISLSEYAASSRYGIERASQSVQLPGLSPSIGATAAQAGIETARNLLSRKTRVVKIKLKAGTAVLLMNKHH